jgi:hypothetical protein
LISIKIAVDETGERKKSPVYFVNIDPQNTRAGEVVA